MSSEAPQRFTGGSTGGKRFVGFASAHHPGTKASIPSRFETILSDNHEANGFGSRTYRFGVSENDLPGPGTYASVTQGLSTRRSQSNYSAHGTSAFASAKKVGFSDDAPLRPTPGPGSYNTGVTRARSPHVGTSAAFSTPVAKRPIAPQKATLPGPGQYEVSQADRKVVCSAFTSRAPRETTPPRATSSYLSSAHVSTFGKDTRVSASMKSRTERFGLAPQGSSSFSAPANGSHQATSALPPLMSCVSGYSVRRPPPSVVLEVGTSAGARKSSTGESGLAISGHPIVSPSTAGDTSPKSPPKPSPMFADTTLDRFGRPTVRYTIAQPNDIGPGHYEQESKTRKMLVSSSWALSAVPRDGIQDRYQPPGPAYYNTEAPPRKVSHRSNVANTWSF